MGFNTSVTLLNDGMDGIEKHPAEFVKGIRARLQSGGTFGVVSHGGIVTVHPSDHADVTQLIAMGGNCSTKVFTGRTTLSYHTEDGQVQLLQQWADALGYRIIKKSD